jgi:amidase
VRSPAANSALVGVVPSRGLVSRAGVLPISFTQDRVGVHAKTTADAAVVLSVMRGFDADDLATMESLEHQVPDLTALPADSLRGVRVGVLRDLFRKNPEAAAGNAIIDKQLAMMTAAGAIVIDGLSTGTDLLGLMPSLRVNSYELRESFDSYLQRRGPSPVKSFAELFNSGKWLKGGVLEARFNDTMKAGDLNTNADYQGRLLNQKMMRQELIALMDRYGVAALVYPMKSLGAPAVGASDDGLRDNNLVSTAGLPAIVVPAGWDAEGLPLALEIMGRPFSDATLLKIAHGYERASKHRLSPKTVPPLTGETIPY